ncbi:MAG: polymerase subunit sigma-24 [Pedosphaera sp.]|nr:polymerase subunit sigma-24 [Pedosphaera sp.]
MLMVELDDEKAWISKCQQGDHEAFELLIKRYQHMIHSLTFRMTGSVAEAEDLAQDTFIQAFRQIGGYRAEARLSSWLYRIAVNLCLNWQKRQHRRERLYSDWSQQQELSNHPDHRRNQQIQDALLKLSPKQRAAIILTTYDGLNHAEAARALGCSETTISWRLFAARAKLKRLLSNVHFKEVQHEG